MLRRFVFAPSTYGTKPPLLRLVATTAVLHAPQHRPPSLKATVTRTQYVELCAKIPNWDKEFAEAGVDTVVTKLRNVGFPPIKRLRMARGILDHIADIPFQSLKVPPLPPCRSANKYYGREEGLKVAAEYIEDILSVKDNGHHVYYAKTGKWVEKFRVLSVAGMKGIGKTEFLLQLGHHVVPKLAKKLNKKARSLYISFKDNNAANATLFNRVCGHGGTGMGKLELRCAVSDAFGHVLLRSCGATLSIGASPKTYDVLEDALKRIRKTANLGEDDILVLLIDDFGELIDNYAIETMKALMGAVEVARGKLVCLFTHVDEYVPRQLAAGSGRVVYPLSLPSLAIDTWKKIPVGRGGLAQWARKDAGLHQLLLGLSGHPRATFEGMPEALRQVPTLLASPDAAALAKAREVILEVCEFKDTTDEYIGTTISKWLAREIANTEKLNCDGLLHEAQTHPARKAYETVKFLFPLKVMQWAKKEVNTNAIAHHTNQMFVEDATNGAEGRKRMEHAIYHLEAAKRIAVGSRLLSLEDYYGYGYDVKFLDGALKCRYVHCKVPSGVDHVYTSPSFATKHMPAVVNHLRAGYIVVPKHLSGVAGVEYLVPFFDFVSRKLLVACVQCKFVKKNSDWSSLNFPVKEVTAYFETNDIEFFHVVYTTADQRMTAKKTFGKGVYLVADDIFRFTNRLGVLRLHCTALGKVLRSKYPFLGK